MSDFEQACRPVIFEYDDPYYAYWGRGSSFLIGSSRAYYWITAAHVLSNQAEPVESLRVFPSDNSQMSLPFNEKYSITKELADDEEYKDIFALRIDLGLFDASGDASLVAQDIEQGVLIAEELPVGAELWVVGYPSENNLVDYDNKKIKATRSVLKAVYQGLSISDHCHELKFETSVHLKSYDGLSGSPIFFFRPVVIDGQSFLFPLLVGMLLRGTASSSRAHFVSANVIINLINKVEGDA